MNCHPMVPQPQGGAGVINCHLALSGLHAGALSERYPAHAVLSRADYWVLNAHRRRCVELGGPRCLRLAHLIRAKLLKAQVAEAHDLPAGVVTGTSRVTFAIGRGAAESRQLYRWHYPGQGRGALPVGSVLGVTLMGMAAGQRERFADHNGDAAEVVVLAVHPQDRPRRAFSG